MEEQCSLEVDVEAHAVAQYMIMRANMAVVLLTTVGGFSPNVFASLPIESRVRLINEAAKTIRPEEVRSGFELIRSKNESDSEGERRKFEAHNSPDKKHDDYLRILAYILGNFDLVRQQAEGVGEMMTEHMVSAGIVHDSGSVH